MVALLAGLFVLTLYPVSVGPIIAVLAIVALMAGAMTPDLDQPAANFFNNMLGSSAIGKIFHTISGGHRHLTHSFVGIIGIGWILWEAIHRFLQPQYTHAMVYVWVAFMIGYISHSVADTITDHGVPWFWPLSFSVKLPPGPEEVRVTTGSFVEMILLRGAILICAFFLLSSYGAAVINFFR